jgi:PRTRC genetic system protein A
MDMRDLALQSVAPTVMVPRFTELEPMAKPGHRFLMASNGLWLEVMRPWLHLRLPLALQDSVSMPYGEVSRVIDLKFGKIPRDLVFEFVKLAQKAMPNETNACITWDEKTGRLTLKPLKAIQADPDFLHYERPRLGDTEHLVVDIHSHGMAPAFFSGLDDKDDKGDVKIAGVVGSCDKTNLTMKFRLCALGIYIPLAFEIAESN